MEPETAEKDATSILINTCFAEHFRKVTLEEEPKYKNLLREFLTSIETQEDEVSIKADLLRLWPRTKSDRVPKPLIRALIKVSKDSFREGESASRDTANAPVNSEETDSPLDTSNTTLIGLEEPTEIGSTAEAHRPDHTTKEVSLEKVNESTATGPGIREARHLMHAAVAWNEKNDAEEKRLDAIRNELGLLREQLLQQKQDLAQQEGQLKSSRGQLDLEKNAQALEIEAVRKLEGDIEQDRKHINSVLEMLKSDRRRFMDLERASTIRQRNLNIQQAQIAEQIQRLSIRETSVTAREVHLQREKARIMAALLEPDTALVTMEESSLPSPVTPTIPPEPVEEAREVQTVADPNINPSAMPMPAQVIGKRRRSIDRRPTNMQIPSTRKKTSRIAAPIEVA